MSVVPRHVRRGRWTWIGMTYPVPFPNPGVVCATVGAAMTTTGPLRGSRATGQVRSANEFGHWSDADLKSDMNQIRRVFDERKKASSTRRYDSHPPGHRRRRSLNIAAAARLLAEDSSFEGDEIQISNADKFHFVRRCAPSSSASVTRAGTPRRGLRGHRGIWTSERGVGWKDETGKQP